MNNPALLRGIIRALLAHGYTARDIQALIRRRHYMMHFNH